jgi:hypothetical protein
LKPSQIQFKSRILNLFRLRFYFIEILNIRNSILLPIRAGSPVHSFAQAIRTDLLSDYTWLRFCADVRTVRLPPALWATRQPSFVMPWLLSRPFTGLRVLRTVPPLPPVSIMDLPN